MFRTAIATTALLLATTAAHAQASDSGTITINADIAEYIDLTVIDSSITYDITDLSPGAPSTDFAGTQQKADFQVTANVDYNIDVAFETWQPSGAPTYQQAAFRLDGDPSGDRIGGSLHLDPTPNSPVTNDVCRQQSSGQLNTDNCGGSSAIEALTDSGIEIFGIGADIAPEWNEDPSEVAQPGIYSLVATITATAE